MKSEELAQRLKTSGCPTVLDVRTGFEYSSGHIPGAVHVPYYSLPLRLKILPEDREAPIVITCEHGPRAVLAKSLLNLAGFRNVELLEGHMRGWRKAGRPVEK
jgi:rhodanese-related sulfurtransferase